MKQCLSCMTLASLLIIAACDDDLRDDLPPPTGDPVTRVFAVAGVFDGGSGVASAIDIPSLGVTRNVVAGVASSDPVVRLIEDRLYIINRFGHDNITILDAASLSFIAQISTGAGSNPQDLAVQGSRLYIPALGTSGVVVIDTEDPTTINTIDLSSFDSSDGQPECNSVILVDDRLFVSCGLLQAFSAVVPGKIVVIDTMDDSVMTSFDLSTKNPFGFLYQTPAESSLEGDLLIGTIDFASGLTTGCIERIGIGQDPGPKGCLVSNETLGGYSTGHVYSNDDSLHVAVTSGFDMMGAVAEVQRYDLGAATLGDTPVNSDGQRVLDLVQCPDGELIFADTLGGIRVYGSDGTEITSAPLDIGLPPVDNGMVCFTR